MNQITEITATTVFKKNYDAFKSDKIYIINEGGSRSSKTWSICQLLIILALEKTRIINVIRNTRVAVRETFYDQDLIPMLKSMGIFEEKRQMKGELGYYFENGSTIKCYGANDEEKIKGLRSDIIYLNEATSIDERIYLQIQGRNEGKIFIDYNPSILKFWVDDIPKEDKVIIYSTYRDNPFVTDSQIKFFESQKEKNPTYYDVYVLGKRGISELNVFPIWKVLNELPITINPNNYVYGIDFGTRHNTVLVKVYYNVDTFELYIEELFCANNLSPTQLINEFDNLNVNKHIPIIADYGGGGNFIIRELRSSSYNVTEADKSQGSVMGGINIMKKYDIYLAENTPTIQYENQMYRYPEKRNNLNENPLKINDDSIDAIRYAVMYIDKYLRHINFDGINC